MQYERKATKSQKLMIWLMGVAVAALLVWGVVEMVGVTNGTTEDTYTEWVADLPTLAIVGIAVFHVVAGVLFIWSAGHFFEWSARRRGEEKRSTPPL